jgi:hypothetical protein
MIVVGSDKSGETAGRLRHVGKSVELDYALLAAWARVNRDGTLTIIDGSFLELTAQLGSTLPLAVAGRIRFLSEPYETTITIELTPPGNHSLSFATLAQASEGTSYGQGRRHVLFAFNTQVPVLSEGQTRVRILLDGEPARDLFYSVSASKPRAE